jgi:hypothetical protein
VWSSRLIIIKKSNYKVKPHKTNIDKIFTAYNNCCLFDSALPPGTITGRKYLKEISRYNRNNGDTLQ